MSVNVNKQNNCPLIRGGMQCHYLYLNLFNATNIMYLYSDLTYAAFEVKCQISFPDYSW